MSRFHLPDDELTWRFSRSSGPGGQHVNTSDTRVELSWNLSATSALTDEERQRVATALRSRLRDGVLTVASSAYRSQHRNRESARVRLEELVAAALVPARPRRATRASRASRKRRREREQRRSALKRERHTDWS
ncbi:alternative ribosome rescue aminoacyl-tRNA hydrolase ArfB [Aeromicrobium sp. CTD01-1L150]|uniref:alternative ribosome rescue aminoacyl-tRNA hydrolase ArfB n=1 Tax=Aeromicrobium sp. CTD01-1L150 TaxID=3341830 RepID=UPI0035BFFF25